MSRAARSLLVASFLVASFLVASTAASTSVAHAGVTPEVELVAGAGRAVGGETYDDAFSNSYTLGVRALGWFPGSLDQRWRIGAEVAVDGMQLDWLDDDHCSTCDDKDMYRLRGLVGGRFELRLAPNVHVFARALAGFDHYRTEGILYQAPGEPIGLQTLVMSGTAFATELGLGTRVSFGRVSVGLQLDLPVAFYRRDRRDAAFVLSGGVSQPVAEQAIANAFLDETAVDLEALLTVGVSF
jgi:hypothetical protein